jgi:hypothetical protein
MSEQYQIINLEKYADFVRKKAARSFAENYEDDVNTFVTLNQTISMIKENSIGKDEEGKYLMDDSSYENLFVALKLRIYNSGLSKLASQGKLECAWDDDKDNMVFWSAGRP